MKTLITGDLAVTEPYSVSLLSQEVVDFFNNSDLNIINLEAPITKNLKKELKSGPHLKSDTQSCKEVLRSLNINVVTLANNHLMDYGAQGVSDTLNFCRQQNIKYVGGGLSLEDASRILYIDSEEGRIAILNIAENEWTAATDKSAGFNPLDVIENVAQIKEAKANSDFLIVIIHGGHEYYSLPSPRMTKQYRYFVEMGADLIVGHHTHCIGGFEIYNNTPIFYSLGNFLFTRHSRHDSWYKGLILEVIIKDGKIHWELHPIKQEQKRYYLSFMNEKEKINVLNQINQYNQIITNKILLEKAWDKYVKDCEEKYLVNWSPLIFIKNPYIRAFFNKIGVRFTNNFGLSYLYNLMRCEAHSDISKEVLKRKLRK